MSDTKLLIVRSSDRNRTIYSNPANFQVSTADFVGVKAVKLHSINITNDFYNVGSTNKQLSLTDGTDSGASNLTEGNYTATELLVELKTVMDVIGATFTTPQTYTLTQVTATNKLNIVASTGDVTIIFDRASTYTTVNSEILGFSRNETINKTSTTSTLLSDKPINMQLNQSIVVNINNLPSAIYNTIDINSISNDIRGQFIIQLDVDKESIFFKNYQFENYANIGLVDFGHMEVELRDMNNTIVTLNSDWFMVVELYF